MRSRQVSAWKAVDSDSTAKVEFVVSLSDQEQVCRFSSNPLFSSLVDTFELRGGLAVDLSGLKITIDPRQQVSPLPSIPSLVFDRRALVEAFGQVPPHPSRLRVEVALVAENIAWADRIVIIKDAPVSHAVIHRLDGGIVYTTEDPLVMGTVKIPPNLIDTSKLPWTATYIQKGVHGMPFPVCMGDMHRTAPIKAYDDGGAANAAAPPHVDEAEPIRRYILCGHLVSGGTATVHRTNDDIAAQNNGKYTDLTGISIQTAETTDGVRFSYIETDGASGGGPPDGDEDPTLSPPKECHAISFEASSGDDASLGGVLRTMLTSWTDINIDDVLGRSIADLVDALRPLKMSVMINGDGADGASAKEMIDQRFGQHAPVSTARYGGHLFMVSLLNLFTPPGFGYLPPAAVFNLDGECHVNGDVKETGEIFNDFELRYKRRESRRWEEALYANPDNDFQCARSKSFYGLRQAPSVDLPDIADGASAGLVLQYLRDVHVFPWYEMQVFAPFEFSWLIPAQKVKLKYSEDNEVVPLISPSRYTSNVSTASGVTSVDAIVTSIEYRREGLIFSVIF